MKTYHPAESDKINELVREVWNTLGSGFTGDVYADVLEREFLRNGVPYERNPKVDIYYKGAVLPHTYRADFIVFGKIVLRLTSSVKIDEGATRELISVLKATKNSFKLHINWANNMPFVSRVIVASKFINSTNIGATKHLSSPVLESNALVSALAEKGTDVCTKKGRPVLRTDKRRASVDNAETNELGAAV